jgi:hypothetical protein
MCIRVPLRAVWCSTHRSAHEQDRDGVGLACQCQLGCVSERCRAVFLFVVGCPPAPFTHVQASPSCPVCAGADAQIFTSIAQGGNYGPPGGFCFDVFCADTPMQTDPNLEDYNVQSRVDDFVAAANNYYGAGGRAGGRVIRVDGGAAVGVLAYVPCRAFAVLCRAVRPSGYVVGQGVGGLCDRTSKTAWVLPLSPIPVRLHAGPSGQRQVWAHYVPDGLRLPVCVACLVFPARSSPELAASLRLLRRARLADPRAALLCSALLLLLCSRGVTWVVCLPYTEHPPAAHATPCRRKRQ